MPHMQGSETSQSLGSFSTLFKLQPQPLCAVRACSCPCVHENFYSNQRWCCGDMDHLDISEDAFALVSAVPLLV